MPTSAGYAPPGPHYAGPRKHVKHRRSRTSVDGQVFGALMLVFGLGWLLRETGAIALSWEGLLASVLIVLGVGMVVTAHARAGGGLVVLGIVLTVMLASTSSISVDKVGSVGDRHIAPTTAEQLLPEYRLFAGDFTLDLTAVPFPDGETTTRIDMSFGKVLIVVPEELPVFVEASVNGGEVSLFGTDFQGSDIEPQHIDQGYESAARKLHLRIDNGLGQVTVERRRALPQGPPSRPEAPAPPAEPVGPR